MTGEVVMRRVESGARFPELHCARCLGLVGPDGRVIWNATADTLTVTPIALCSDECEAGARADVPDVELARLSIAEYVFFLAAGTATSAAVGHLIDQEALGRFLMDVNQPKALPKDGTRGDACQN